MLTPDFVKTKFEQALPYDEYVASGQLHEQDNWKNQYERVAFTDQQAKLLGSFERQVNALFVSGTWCGDCVQQMPIVGKIAAASNGRVNARFLDKDKNMDLADHLKICGGHRVPVGVLLNEDFDVLALVGDRLLSKYRLMAEANLGGACPMPGAPIPDNEIAAVTQDYVDQFERAHLICRLSTKLRQRYGD
ncbi:MAG: thioredoxin family protein [Planctomycetota bacterium]